MNPGVHPKKEIGDGVAIFWKYGIQRKMKMKMISERYSVFPVFMGVFCIY